MSASCRPLWLALENTDFLLLLYCQERLVTTPNPLLLCVLCRSHPSAGGTSRDQ